MNRQFTTTLVAIFISFGKITSSAKRLGNTEAILCSNGIQQCLRHERAVRDLMANGIAISSLADCSDHQNPRCTSFHRVRMSTLDGVIALKLHSGCDITIIAGTERTTLSWVNKKKPARNYLKTDGYRLEVEWTHCLDSYMKDHLDLSPRHRSTDLGSVVYCARNGNTFIDHSHERIELVFGDGC